MGNDFGFWRLSLWEQPQGPELGEILQQLQNLQ
jgi:hypothetical protein